jgi:hypothetical protein
MTVAVKFCIPPTFTLALAGEMVTEVGDGGGCDKEGGL